jgi:hypothetical protein
VWVAGEACITVDAGVVRSVTDRHSGRPGVNGGMVSDETVRLAALHFTAGGLFLAFGTLLGRAVGGVAGGGIGLVLQLVVFAPALYLASRFLAEGIGTIVAKETAEA